MIEEQKVPDLSGAELALLLKHADRGHKGWVAIDVFIQKLQGLLTESKSEITIRTFAANCKRQQVNLKQELFKYDTSRTGRIDKKTFSKAMNQLPVSMQDDTLDLLFQAGEAGPGLLDIQSFINKVIASLKYTPPPNIDSVLPKKQGSKQSGAATPNNFESWEIEKKYKTKLQALQQQIEESKKETQAVEKQARHWQDMANRVEKEKNALQARLVDFNAKPPRAQTIESNT